MNVRLCALTAVEGVPLTTPEFEKLRPAGRDPFVIDHVYGDVPPEAARVAEYADPTVPAGRDVVELLRGCGLGLGAA